MQLPKYQKKKRIKLKVCHEPGCGKEFLGHPIAKYCPLHKDIKNRARKIKEVEPVDFRNIIFKHTFSEVTEVQFSCQVPDCTELYSVKIYPKQYIYPKFCEKHRNEFKRHNL
jgi:hypothetical protein